MTRLASYGGDPNSKDAEGYTPLVNAMRHGDAIVHTKLVENLLKIGADPNSTTQSGDTALHYAVEMYPEPDDDPDEKWYEEDAALVIKLLLRYGANPELRNRAGQTAIDLMGESVRRIYTDFARQEEARNRGKAVRGLVESEKAPLSKQLPEDVAGNISSFLTGKRGTIKQQVTELKKESKQGGRSRLHKKTRRSKGKRGYTKRR